MVTSSQANNDFWCGVLGSMRAVMRNKESSLYGLRAEYLECKLPSAYLLYYLVQNTHTHKPSIITSNITGLTEQYSMSYCTANARINGCLLRCRRQERETASRERGYEGEERAC